MRNRRTSLTAAERGIETPREMGSPLPPDEGDRRAERDRAVKAAWAKVDWAGLRDEVELLVEHAAAPLKPTRYIVGDSSGRVVDEVDVGTLANRRERARRLLEVAVGLAARGTLDPRVLSRLNGGLAEFSFVADGQERIYVAVSGEEAWPNADPEAFLLDRLRRSCLGRFVALWDTQVDAPNLIAKHMKAKAPRLLPSKDKAAERLAAFTVAQDKRRQEAAALNREIARARVEVGQDPALQARRKAALESMAKREQALVESARRRKQEWMTSPAGIHHENERLLRRAGRAMKATIRTVTGCRARASVFRNRVEVTAKVSKWLGTYPAEVVRAEVTLEQCHLFRTNLEQMATQVAANALEAHRVMVDEERGRESETAFLRPVAHALKHRQLGMQGATATASKVDLSHREAADIVHRQMLNVWCPGGPFPGEPWRIIVDTPIGRVCVDFKLARPPDDSGCLDTLFGFAKTYGHEEWLSQDRDEYIKVKVLR